MKNISKKLIFKNLTFFEQSNSEDRKPVFKIPCDKTIGYQFYDAWEK
uniref:Uncharacterized protein n=1 Tax=viral metagenome TaxID=1070528 RepID=A0A6C0C9W7_9ZZZZ